MNELWKYFHAKKCSPAWWQQLQLFHGANVPSSIQLSIVGCVNVDSGNSKAQGHGCALLTTNGLVQNNLGEGLLSFFFESSLCCDTEKLTYFLILSSTFVGKQKIRHQSNT